MAEVSQQIHLNFQQAMQDFKTMFPGMDSEIIEAVLRANKGAVHATIDQLLCMAMDEAALDQVQSAPAVPLRLSEATNFECPPSYTLSTTPPPSYNQAVPSSQTSARTRPSESSHRKWNPPLLLPLPKDFLRISFSPLQTKKLLSPHRLSQRLSDNAEAREAVGQSDAELARYLKDERIALFLQNDEFINELKSNKEFMNSLQLDHEDEETRGREKTQSSGLNTLASSKPRSRSTSRKRVIPPIDDAMLRERISNMSKASRRKFAQIASVFSRNKRATMPRSFITGSSSASNQNGKNLLVSDDPLMGDDSEGTDSQVSPVHSSPKFKH